MATLLFEAAGEQNPLLRGILYLESRRAGLRSPGTWRGEIRWTFQDAPALFVAQRVARSTSARQRGGRSSL